MDAEAECIERNIRIKTTKAGCTCKFFCTMHLPCEHIMAFLALHDGEEMFRPDLCAARWKRETARYISAYDYTASIPTTQFQIQQSTEVPRPSRRLTVNEKFRAAEKETKKICEILSEMTQSQFDLHLKTLKDFRSCVEEYRLPGS